eukprot:945668-Pyramimonas_sp.AAC.1
MMQLIVGPHCLPSFRTADCGHALVPGRANPCVARTHSTIGARNADKGVSTLRAKLSSRTPWFNTRVQGLLSRYRCKRQETLMSSRGPPAGVRFRKGREQDLPTIQCVPETLQLG